jgi:hypothetical protein
MIKVAGVKIADGNLIVVVEGETSAEVISPEARRLAYDERIKHGFENGALDTSARPFAVDRSKLVDGDLEAGAISLPDQMKSASANKSLAFRAEYKLSRLTI